MSLVCTPDKFVEEALIIKPKSFANGKVIIALNVRQDVASHSVMIADEINKGNHWALLALDTETKHAYYGDIPRNFTCMIKPLVGIQLDNYTVSLINSASITNSSQLFYPTQTCSNLCVVS